jgi:hypothetical protein
MSTDEVSLIEVLVVISGHLGDIASALEGLEGRLEEISYSDADTSGVHGHVNVARCAD